MKISEITQKMLLDTFKYEDGHFIRRFKQGKAKAGCIACETMSSKGYLNVKIKGCKFPLHRLVWLYHYGKFPDNQIDHINHIKTDNRIENLRDVTNLENGRNQSKHRTNSSGYTGVYMHQSGKWVGQINIHGKTHAKYFNDKNDAILHRKSLEVKYVFHKNHGE